MNVDPMGYHDKLKQLQLIITEIFLLFALWVTSTVLVSSQFMIVVLKIKRKQKLLILIYSVGALLVVVSYILSIYMIVQISNWKIEDFSVKITYYHLSISVICCAFLLLGQFFILKTIFSLKDNSDKHIEKKKQYIFLSLSIVAFTVGSFLCIIVIAIYNDLNPWVLVYLAYFASVFYSISPLLIFKNINKKRSSSKGSTVEKGSELDIKSSNNN
jgi:uncharacterized membrane protein